MKIHIIGFRCYTDSKFELCDNDLSLLKGASGIGKSTLLQAISWCLFGKIIRGVDPKSSPNGKLSVTIQHNGVTIYRQKRPNIVRVTKADGKTYDSDVADHMISAIYGSALLWPIVGYIQQGEINRLLSSSNADRMELLNKLTFDGCPDDQLPEIQIDKIDKILAATTNDYSLAQALLTQEITSFTAELTRLNNGCATLDVSKILSDTIIQDKRTTITALQAEYQSLIKQRAQHEYATNTLKTLRERLTIVEKRIVVSGSLDDIERQIEGIAMDIRHNDNQLQQISNERTTLSSGVSKLKEQLGLFKHRDTLQSQLNSFEQQHPTVIGNTTRTYNQAELQTAINQEVTFSRHTAICQSLGLEYSSAIITAELIRIKLLIEQQPKVQKYHELKALVATTEARLAKLTAELPKYDGSLADIVAKISDITATIQHIELSRKTLRCPHCQKGVKYSTNGKLEVVAGDYKQSAQDITDYHLQLEALAKANAMRDNITRGEAMTREITRVTEELKIITAQYTALATDSTINSSKLLNSHELGVLYQRQQQLLSLQISPMISLPEVPSKSIIVLQEYQALQDKLASVNKIISGPTPDEAGILDRQQQLVALDNKYSTMSGVINQLNTKLTGLRNTKQQSLLDQTVIKQLTDDIASNSKLLTANIEVLLLENSKQQTALQLAIDDSLKISRLLDQRNVLQAKQDKLLKLGQRRADLLKMKELAIQCECQQLSVTVDALNNAIGSIAVYLFDSPITIKINLFKTVKTTQRIKPTVNVTVNYKGNDYDSLVGLSGGERDRISLCVTLAMNRISGCPLLFLDEVIGTLDAGLTETAIKSIKVSTVGKTCLLVSHSAVEGVFRDVVQFG